MNNNLKLKSLIKYIAVTFNINADHSYSVTTRILLKKWSLVINESTLKHSLN